MPITTRVATTTDIPEAAAVLAEAFDSDPLMATIWPDQKQRRRALPVYFAASLRYFHVPHGGVDVASDGDGKIAAVAVWDPPGQWDHSTMTTVRALPDLLPALRTRALTAIRVRRTLDEHHPRAPGHWYLANIGSTQSVRGQGYAARLITDRVTSPSPPPAYLVCTRERNIPYYARFGFEVAESFALPAGERPPMWAMRVNM
ncbi:N-acetyltransferase [Nocardia jinanensis]|uniref:N-acetyltransferase n=1 Tax=Nocardia jinanensis TaxID=382504 RepID=A0A917RRC2_9NOCA|nr:N-acetyltransferase [Nocardia jinanensis]GGL20539.1 N-acetyltransferase [Nocardia jinanensis]